MSWKDKIGLKEEKPEAIIPKKKEETIDEDSLMMVDSLQKDEEVRLFLAVERGKVKFNILQKLNNP